MDLVGLMLLLTSVGLMIYMFINRNHVDKATIPALEDNKIIQAEQLRRLEIVQKVDSFLKSSQFIEPIAKLNDEPIYNYVFNEGYLYKFDEIMPTTNQRIGMDENFLCFKKLCYKRVNNPIEFISHFSEQIVSKHNI